MRRLLARRLLGTLFVVVAAATTTFALAHLAPGDPFVATFENPSVTPAIRARMRASYGLDQPLPVQYARWVALAARGDLGHSTSLHRPVRDAIAEALPRTMLLMGIALVLGFALGVALGAWQAARRGRPLERLASTLALALTAVPEFWLAMLAMLLLAYRFPVFPVAGMIDVASHDYMTAGERLVDRVRHLVLPVLVVAIPLAASIARFQRVALLEAMGEDFVRTARAKGLSERRVILRHALRNALGPTVALMGLALPALAGGAVFVEKIFSWPGMGGLAVDAISTRDYPLILGCVLVGSVVVALGALLADLLAAAIDPRVRDAVLRQSVATDTAMRAAAR